MTDQQITNVTSGVAGMDRQTGKPLDDEAHLAQSIADILTTPLGSRIMRRDYGSLLYELIDAPLNTATRQLLIASSAAAIHKWEPRLTLRKIGVSTGAAAIALTLSGIRTDRPKALSAVDLTIPVGGNPVAPVLN